MNWLAFRRNERGLISTYFFSICLQSDAVWHVPGPYPFVVVYEKYFSIFGGEINKRNGWYFVCQFNYSPLLRYFILFSQDTYVNWSKVFRNKALSWSHDLCICILRLLPRLTFVQCSCRAISVFNANSKGRTFWACQITRMRVQRLFVCVSLFLAFPYFEKIKGGLWNHLTGCLCNGPSLSLSIRPCTSRNFVGLWGL